MATLSGFWWFMNWQQHLGDGQLLGVNQRNPLLTCVNTSLPSWQDIIDYWHSGVCIERLHNTY